MIKGCRRSVILVKGDEESIFECAYFVLKNGDEPFKMSDEDMVAEANKIIEASNPECAIKINENDKKTCKKSKNTDKTGKKIIIPFSIGAAVGSAAGLLWLFL